MTASNRFEHDDGAERPGSAHLPRSIIDWLISDEDRETENGEDSEDDRLASACPCSGRPSSP
ncbi:hypothetical protein [Streptacidiphilus fuscans]|uniref:Uncharacterized protein n=1 Tax=Streptacidiphilus fuscans TaxID=2789292 RepID=A0A931FC09_9ACTN|nr:hypothetical protein [Streptacidiphilus fuscans]MBF9069227.1 hypothetical protein [Streptacidiphilus fuscans]